MPTKYMECVITKHHAGFGMYEAGEANGEAWDHLSDLRAEMMRNLSNCKPLAEALKDAEFIAAGVEDIRGKCYRQPKHIFANLEANPHTGENEVSYYGIVVR